jgi:hypothetical protein
MGIVQTATLGVALLLISAASVPLMAQSRGGTPSIMVEEGVRPKAAKSSKTDARKPRMRVRGSSTYIPPSVPSPNAGPPAPSLTQPGPGVYQPPKINSFGDRSTNCIHAAPLNAGVGNNPSELGAFTRSCAN